MIHEIIVCDNRETVCGGYTDDRTDVYAQDLLDAWTTGAMATFEDFQREQPDIDVELRFNSTFRDWNGGKYSVYQCGKEFGGHTYGYHSGLVATLSVDPPQWLRELVDRIDVAASNERQDRANEVDAEVFDDVEGGAS